MEKEEKPAATFKEYIENAKSVTDVFRWIWREGTTKQSRRKIGVLFTSLGVMIVLQGVQPGAVAYIFDGLVARNRKLIWWGVGTFFVCQIVQRIAARFLESAREWIISIHWGRIDDRITALFFEKSMGQHIRENVGLSVTNIDKGRWRLLDLQNMFLFEGLPTVAQIGVAYLLLCLLSWQAGLVMGFVIAVYIVWSLFLNFRVNQVYMPIDQEFRTLNRRRIERWKRIERVKMTCREKGELVEMSRTFEDVSDRGRKFWLWFIDQTNMRAMVNGVGLTVIMGWGAYLVWTGSWKIGLLYPLYAWSSRVSENIWRLGEIEHSINWNMPSVKSMMEALLVPPEIVDRPNAVELDHRRPHRIEFREVSHTYPPGAKRTDEMPPALVKVSFTIEPGDKVALIGESGAGKTTVMKKLLRFEDPTSGTILVDGIDLREIKQTSWLRGIGYVPQQAQVLDGSMRYNLTYGLPDDRRTSISDDELWRHMRLLEIDFKDRLVQGLETVVGESGMLLSGGQSQRVMIGAAALKDLWLLIVDEATSNLDSTTERKIQEGLSSILLGDRPVSALIVAHRLSTVRKICNKFVVLRTAREVKNGDSQIEAVAGSFEELYKTSETFRRLATDQEIAIKC